MKTTVKIACRSGSAIVGGTPNFCVSGILGVAYMRRCRATVARPCFVNARRSRI